MTRKDRYSHVLWIGGATDCGKTTVAAALAERLGFQVYHYDHFDVGHHDILAQTDEKIRESLASGIEERWVQQTPEKLVGRFLRAAKLRFPLVLNDFAELDSSKPVVAEGFGFLPKLIDPLISANEQAIFLVPSEKFKRESFERRGKPSWKMKISDPERGWHNLFTRDMMIADIYRKEVPNHGYQMIEVDSQSPAEMVDLLEKHFKKYLV
ncbi:MAG: hypothetical protein AAGD96_15855 [Chloroflexota bacterium]